MPPDIPAQAGAAARQLDRLERLALAYLGLPLLLFIWTWLQPLPALGVTALLVAGAAPVWRAQRPMPPRALPSRWLVAVLVVGLLWAALGGLAGGLRLNDDWQVRSVLLRDLVQGDWPVAYAGPRGETLLLRFPMAYYLLPAALGKVAGLTAAQLALWCWTALGVAMLLALALNGQPLRSGQAVVVVAVLVLFSGLDALGWWMDKGRLPRFGEHIEWWHWMFQYSSHTTLLFWAPNHALPGWLAGVLVWRHRQAGLALAPMAAWLVAMVMWSPLAAFGAAPLLLAAVWRGAGWRAAWREARHPAPWLLVPVALLLSRFVTVGVPAGTTEGSVQAAWNHLALFLGLLPQLIEFSALEWALLVAVLWAVGARSWLLAAASLELLLLPALRLGPGNDIVMRGGIPAMTVVALTAAATLVDPRASRRGRAALAGLLALGALTTVLEVQRSFLPRSPEAAEDRNFVQLFGKPWHYVGERQPGWLWLLLREPVAWK